jgi:hypothetical protein
LRPGGRHSTIVRWRGARSHSTRIWSRRCAGTCWSHQRRTRAILRDDPARFSRTYRLLLSAFRAEGIGPGRLPDFLGIEHGGELALLGQEELDISALEAELREQIGRRPATIGWPEPETERILRHPGAAPHP